MDEPLGQRPLRAGRETAVGYFSPTDLLPALRVLRQAGVGRRTRLLDLGSGAGHILVVAAAVLGAQVVGFEMDPELLEESSAWVAALEQGGLIRPGQAQIRAENFLEVEWPEADRIYHYPLLRSSAGVLLGEQRQLEDRLFLYVQGRPDTRLILYGDETGQQYAFSFPRLNAQWGHQWIPDLATVLLTPPPAVGVEEVENQQVRSALRETFGAEAADSLLLEDIRAIRWAPDEEDLSASLDLYARALEKPLSIEAKSTLMNRLRPLMLQPRGLPPDIRQAIDAMFQQNTWESFMEQGIPNLQAALKRYVLEHPDAEHWTLEFRRFLDPPAYTEAEVGILQRSAQAVCAALLPDPSRAAQEAQALVGITWPSSLPLITDRILSVHRTSFQGEGVAFKRFFDQSIRAIVQGPVFTASLGPDRPPLYVVVSAGEAGNSAARLAGESAHEYGHVLLGRQNLIWNTVAAPPPGGTDPSDWITRALEDLTGEEVDLEQKGPGRTDGRWFARGLGVGPTVLAWAFREGQRIATLPTERWAQEISAIPFPKTSRYYGSGIVIGGVALQVGREVASAQPQYNPFERGRRLVGRYALEAQAPTLDELGRVARQFRQEHGLSPEHGVGLEESVQLPQGALTNRVIFLGPEVATPQLFAALSLFKPVAGERLGLVVFARNAAHKRVIEAGLEEAGLVPLESVVDVNAQYDGDLAAAVTDRQLAYFARNTDVHVLFTFAGLEELGRFLHVPDVSFRAWQKKLERQLEFQA